MNEKRISLVVLVFSLGLYTLTLEPTTSFWDCSEFILSAAKLEINHPAGAPLYMLLGRLFSLLSFGNLERIAWSINFMSGFFSALTLFFLFKVIVLLVQKITNDKILILGSSFLGAITFGLTDSFWFSAVEGEVYSMSMFFLISSFWAALKWEQEYKQKGSEKWILFLALLTGLGIGVHLLNLLVLPSVVLLIGTRTYGFSIKKMLVYFSLGLVLLLFVLYVLTPLPLKFLAFLDYLFVNRLNMPLHSGTISGVVLLFSFLVFVVFYFKKKGKHLAELLALSVLMLLFGFSIYSVNIIRSGSNPPVNFGRPDTIYSLINYLNREQYPKRPLFYGQNYNSPVLDVKERYSKDFLEGEYKEIKLASEYVFDEKTTGFFPRMYSMEERHSVAYNKWIKIKGRKVSVKDARGDTENLLVPNFSDQVKFFIKYQFGYMFGRYFMWNFVGRQNDRQGNGTVLNGNWISGIDFLDSARLGEQQKIPLWAKNNKARNTYFFLPLILGSIGLVFQYKRNRETFYVVFSLFLMGSLGLTFYINEVPITPRERDYVFVVAFLAFSIWIGFSFTAIVIFMQKVLSNDKFKIPVFIVLILICPALLAYQNFDDHNRSKRFAARDFAENILNSCPESSILFTSGDNDTYPLLYCQEVENLRTDVRIVILPFLSANWFIDGLRNPKYEEEGLNMILPQKKYDFGKLEYLPLVNAIHRNTSWQEALEFVKSDNPRSKRQLQTGENIDFLPTQKFSIPISEKGEIPVSLNKQGMYKHELAFWDIISSNISERPICFVSKNEASKYGLQNYLKCKGFVYQLTHEYHKNDVFSLGYFDEEELYNQLLHDFKWGNLNEKNVYVDWNTITNAYVFQIHNVFNEVAGLFLEKGKRQKASELLKKCYYKFPKESFPYDIFTLRQNELLFAAGLEKEANELFNWHKNNILQSLDFYFFLNKKQQQVLSNEIRNELYYLSRLVEISVNYIGKEKSDELNKQLEKFLKHG